MFERTFLPHSFANRVGFGTHRAITRCGQLAERFRFVLTRDIRQHFASIDHEILLRVLAARVRDADVLELCRRIIAGGRGVLDADYDFVGFPGDDLFARLRPRGLPIGNLTSQFWSNCYLDSLDHFIVRDLRCTGYVRYVDDFLLFGNDAGELWEWKRRVMRFLERLRLTIHSKAAQVRPIGVGIPWLGFVQFTTHRRVKRRKVVEFQRRLKHRIRGGVKGAAGIAAISSMIQGWVAHVRHADTLGLRRAILGRCRIQRVGAGGKAHPRAQEEGAVTVTSDGE